MAFTEGQRAMNVADSKTKKIKMKVEVRRHGESMIWANDVILRIPVSLVTRGVTLVFFVNLQSEPTILDIRDLKIPGREVPGRLQEVNLHNRACARELSTHLASSRTSFHPICRRIENVSILRLFLLEKCYNRCYLQLY